jgi:hypothetical protein
MLARLGSGRPLPSTLAALACSVLVAGCLGPGGGGDASMTLSYSVDPFNATVPYRVSLPVPQAGAGLHPLVGSLALTEGKGNWTVEVVDGERALVVVGVGRVAITASVSGPEATPLLNLERINWTHAHPLDLNGTRGWGNQRGTRDAVATASAPLVLGVSASMASGGGGCRSQDSAAGTIRSNGSWTALPTNGGGWCV